jgi:Trk-type K+ transport system membrane component
MTTTRGLAKGIKRPDFFVMQQVQRQLSSDLAWIVVGIFLICVIESGPIMSTSPITVFSVIYECVSAFANVGASLGYPGTSTSQSAQYHTLSKLVIICLMYRGRHRGKLKSNRDAKRKKKKTLRTWHFNTFVFVDRPTSCYR